MVTDTKYATTRIISSLEMGTSITLISRDVIYKYEEPYEGGLSRTDL